MKVRTVFLLGICALAIAANGYANMDQIKTYKEAYPDTKPKCLACHVDQIPKKDDGKHDLNAYGNAAEGLANPPTKDEYLKIGPIEEFKSDNSAAEAAPAAGAGE